MRGSGFLWFHFRTSSADISFHVKMEQFYSNEPDTLKIDYVVIDEYEDILDTGNFSKQHVYIP